MKIQLSPIKIVKDALVVWNTQEKDVDIVMDLKNLTFKPASLEEIYSFHVLDGFFPEEALQAATNWRKCLQVNGKLFSVVDDFEYVARAFTGGDISIDMYNEIHNHPSQYTRESLVSLLRKAGFKDDLINIWLGDTVRENLFTKRHYEIVLESKRHE